MTHSGNVMSIQVLQLWVTSDHLWTFLLQPKEPEMPPTILQLCMSFSTNSSPFKIYYTQISSEIRLSIWIFPMMTAQSPSNASQPPQSAAPAQHSPCHSPFLCPCSLGPRTVTWALGEHALSPLSCHCAPQCQTLSDKGPDPPPCCYFWPRRRGERKLS